jgi:hypothetical protein
LVVDWQNACLDLLEALMGVIEESKLVFERHT